MAYCVKCGNELQEGALFCANCGHAVDQNVPTKLQEKETSNGTYTHPVYESPEDKTVPKYNKIFTILGIASLAIAVMAYVVSNKVLVVVLALVAIAIAIVSLIKKCRYKAVPIISIVITVILLSYILLHTNSSDDANSANQITSSFTTDIGSLTFSVPDSYKYDNDNGYYVRDDGKTILLLEMHDDAINPNDFKYKGMDAFVNILANDVFSSYEIISTSDLKVSGNDTTKYTINGKFKDINIDEGDLNCCVINNFKNKEFMLIGVISKAGINGESDFDYIVESAVDNPNYKAKVDSNRTDDSKNTTDDTGRVNTDLKAFLDSYEDFVDEYVIFMNKYKENPSDLSMLAEYTEILEKYSDFAEKVNSYDTSSMSKEDYNYYIDVTTRCSKKLLEVAY